MQIPRALDPWAEEQPQSFQASCFQTGHPILSSANVPLATVDFELTFSTIDPWIQPLTGGKALAYCARTETRTASSLISHGGAAAFTPFSWSSFSRAVADSVVAPERDNNSNCFARRLIIHRAMLRPRPPRPPLITYVASWSKYHDGLLVGIVYCD